MCIIFVLTCQAQCERNFGVGCSQQIPDASAISSECWRRERSPRPSGLDGRVGGRSPSAGQAPVMPANLTTAIINNDVWDKTTSLLRIRSGTINRELEGRSVRTLSSKLWFFVSVLLVAVVLFAALSRKYVWLYVSRRVDPPPPGADLLRDPGTTNNPEVLLEEANRLAWLSNWPKAEPLYIRAEALF